MPQKSDFGSYEKANKKGHVPIIESDLEGIIEQFTVADVPPVEKQVEEDIRNLELPEFQEHHIIGIDGSRAEVPLDSDENIKVGFIQIAAVTISPSLVNIEPQIVDTDLSEYKVEKLHLVVPSQGLRTSEEKSLTGSWREILNKQFEKQSLFGLSLNEAIQQIAEGEKLMLDACPNPNCGSTDLKIHFERATNKCQSCGEQVYISDIANAYEELSIRAPNLGPLESLMGFIENIAVYISVKHATEDGLQNPIIIKDGPLAEYKCHEKWTKNRLEKNIKSLRDDNSYPIVVGINKSGDFYQHARSLEKFAEETTLIELPQKHIRDYVKSSSTSNQFGRDSYYGKQFIYYDTDRRPHVFSVPRIYSGQDLYTSMDDYPWVRYLTTVIESLRTPHFDGLIPLTIAHNEASIPDNNVARDALSKFSNSALDKN